MLSSLIRAAGRPTTAAGDITLAGLTNADLSPGRDQLDIVALLNPPAPAETWA
jgi:hypothetical protein